MMVLPGYFWYCSISNTFRQYEAVYLLRIFDMCSQVPTISPLSQGGWLIRGGNCVSSLLPTLLFYLFLENLSV
jgi:hypothetical protein